MVNYNRGIILLLLWLIFFSHNTAIYGKTENNAIVNNAELPLSSPLKSLITLDTTDISHGMKVVQRELIETKCCLSLISGLKNYSDITSFIKRLDIYIPSLAEYSLKSLMRNNEKEKALIIARMSEPVIERMRRNSQNPNMIDRAVCHYYALLAYLYQINGNECEASSHYKKYLHTNYAKTIKGRYWINSYLLEIGCYDSVIKNNEEFCENLLKEDTVNSLYVNILSQNAKALYYKNEQEKAYETSRKCININEQIRKGNYKIILSYYEKNDSSKYIKAILILLGLILIIITSVFLYKKCVKPYKSQKVDDEKARKQMLHSLPVLPYDEKSLYIVFKDYVKEQKLFLNPELDRDYYAALMKVDKNRFARIIQNYSNTNLKGLLNSLRLEYAVNLMKMNSDYPIDKIAEKSGITSMSTFYRLFKNKYGIGPQEFRKQI